MVACV